MTPARAQDLEHRDRLARALAGQFELRDRLGAGGFAEVYAAHDVKLQRDVAIKTLRSELHADPMIKERFLREARTVAQLRHEHILPVYSVGESDGVAYFVMPLVEGDSLNDYLETKGRLEIDETLRLLGEIGEALSHAHDAGLVHRDVKPDNVMLEGDGRRALVMDFGIAKAVEMQGPALTGTGMIVGTPLYMSPEQASADQQIDGRADLYSLGVVGYQMLTGAPPFTGASAQAIIIRHIAEDPAPVQTRRRDCPEAMAAAVDQCLAKDPANRFATVDDFLAALRGESAVPSGRRSWRAGPVARFRRITWTALGLAVATTIVNVFLGGFLVFPFVWAGATLVIAVTYGGVWHLGVSFTDALRGSGVEQRVIRSVATTPTGAYGTYTARVSSARGERAVIAGLLVQVPRSQRNRLPPVLASADAMVARVRALGRQVTQLDRIVDGGGRPGAGSSQLHEVRERRAALAGELDATYARLVELRETVVRMDVAGVESVSADLVALCADRSPSAT